VSRVKQFRAYSAAEKTQFDLYFYWLFLDSDKESPEEIVRRGKAKVGFCPLQAVSLQTLEAGTVTFSLARLPGR
jgi:hypothetical protein